MNQGYLALLLHAHLPFVRHPEHDDFLEEDWLYEAITETYLPLLRTFEGLRRDRVDFRLAMVLSPTLVAMLRDPLLQERYGRYLDRRVELADKELERTTGDARFHALARMYRDHFVRCRHDFGERYRRDLVGAFGALQEAGFLELLTCAATHGFLPLLELHPEAVRAQVRVGVTEYERHFGRRPRGFWLPECAYTPRVGAALAAENVRYVVTDAHGVVHARPRPRFGVHAPVFTPSGVAAFARDAESSKQVWSASEGYPGDPAYREFYRDIGYDLDARYVGPYIQPTGERKNTGFKYYRITGDGDHKEPYDAAAARERAAQHAANFQVNRAQQIEWLAGQMKRPPIVLAPYDAELFGHWWWEGPQFLDFVLRKSVYDQHVYTLTTPGAYLCEHATQQLCELALSSWGDRGYASVWLNERNDWVYPHLHMAQTRMTRLADEGGETSGVAARALAQAGRELLLAQASDWPFLMSTGTAVDYATRRVRRHLHRFTRLYEQIRDDRVDTAWLRSVEQQDNLFPELDVRVFRSA